MKKLFLNFIIFSLLYSCGGNSNIGKVLRNEKITNSDEFLVKKRDPLTMPPDHTTLPKPGKINNSKKDNSYCHIERTLKSINRNSLNGFPEPQHVTELEQFNFAS